MFQRFKKMIIVEINRCRRAERRSTIDWLTDSKSKKISNWHVSKTRKRRSTIDWLIDSKSKKIDNWLVSWRFFLLFHSRRRHASWSLSKRTSHSDDFILNTRVFLRAMKILFLLAYFYEQWRFSLITRVFLRASDDLILFIRVFRRAICFAENLIEQSLISLILYERFAVQETVNHRHCELIEISCWRRNRHKLTTILFLFTRWSSW